MFNLRFFQFIFIFSLFTTQTLTKDNLKELSERRIEFIKGVDVSMLNQIEENGGVFKENGVPKDALEIFKNHGINFVRLRLWHTPTKGYNNLTKTLIMASRIKALNMGFLLDFHYSDTWADPGHQAKPVAWENLDFESLKDSVYQYTRHVINELKTHNVLPDIVQIGNEITCGILWNYGRICGEYDTPNNWARFVELLKEGIRGVHESLDVTDTIKIMIHIDRGGDNAGSRWFFDNLLNHGVDFDIIGLSYYPWWHGTLSELESNLKDLAQHYDKEIVVVETAYPWTLSWFDTTHNIVGDSSQLLPDYPASVRGQKSFLINLINIILNVPYSKGLGLFYWSPEYISTPQLGSPWENLTLFNFRGELLSSIEAFDSTLFSSELQKD